MDREKAVAYVCIAKKFAEAMRDKWFAYILVNLLFSVLVGILWQSKNLWIFLAMLLVGYIIVTCILASYRKLRHALGNCLVMLITMAFLFSVFLIGMTRDIKNVKIFVYLPTVIIGFAAIPITVIIIERILFDIAKVNKLVKINAILGCTAIGGTLCYAIGKTFEQYLGNLPLVLKTIIIGVFIALTVVSFVAAIVAAIWRLSLAIKYSIEFEEL